MIANCAFAAAVAVLLFAAWLTRELVFLAPYRVLIFREYGTLIGGGLLLLFLNLTAGFYWVARSLFLRDAGQKLAHVDRQLETPDAAVEELRKHLAS